MTGWILKSLCQKLTQTCGHLSPQLLDQFQNIKVTTPGLMTQARLHIVYSRYDVCLCSIMFCTDDWCSIPVHTLIADIVESYGGSTQLVKVLNQLGVCSSADTPARSIQYRVQELKERAPEQDCLPNATRVISTDNIDFLHSYAQIFCEKQTSSWHGTTVQAVQPMFSVLANKFCSPMCIGEELQQHTQASVCRSTFGESSAISFTCTCACSHPRHSECVLP